MTGEEKTNIVIVVPHTTVALPTTSPTFTESLKVRNKIEHSHIQPEAPNVVAPITHRNSERSGLPGLQSSILGYIFGESDRSTNNGYP